MGLFTRGLKTIRERGRARREDLSKNDFELYKPIINRTAPAMSHLNRWSKSMLQELQKGPDQDYYDLAPDNSGWKLGNIFKTKPWAERVQAEFKASGMETHLAPKEDRFVLFYKSPAQSTSILTKDAMLQLETMLKAAMADEAQAMRDYPKIISIIDGLMLDTAVRPADAIKLNNIRSALARFVSDESLHHLKLSSFLEQFDMISAKYLGRESPLTVEPKAKARATRPPGSYIGRYSSRYDMRATSRADAGDLPPDEVPDENLTPGQRLLRHSRRKSINVPAPAEMPVYPQPEYIREQPEVPFIEMPGMMKTPEFLDITPRPVPVHDAPPANPTEGMEVMVGPNPMGDFQAHAGQHATFRSGRWDYTVPVRPAVERYKVRLPSGKIVWEIRQTQVEPYRPRDLLLEDLPPTGGSIVSIDTLIKHVRKGVEETRVALQVDRAKWLWDATDFSTRRDILTSLGLPDAVGEWDYLPEASRAELLPFLVNLIDFQKAMQAAEQAHAMLIGHSGIVTEIPVNAHDGMRVIIGQNATGGFAGHDGEVATYYGTTNAWAFEPPERIEQTKEIGIISLKYQDVAAAKSRYLDYYRLAENVPAKYQIYFWKNLSSERFTELREKQRVLDMRFRGVVEAIMGGEQVMPGDYTKREQAAWMWDEYAKGTPRNRELRQQILIAIRPFTVVPETGEYKDPYTEAVYTNVIDMEFRNLPLKVTKTIAQQLGRTITPIPPPAKKPRIPMIEQRRKQIDVQQQQQQEERLRPKIRTPTPAEVQEMNDLIMSMWNVATADDRIDMLTAAGYDYTEEDALAQFREKGILTQAEVDALLARNQEIKQASEQLWGVLDARLRDYLSAYYGKSYTRVKDYWDILGPGVYDTKVYNDGKIAYAPGETASPVGHFTKTAAGKEIWVPGTEHVVPEQIDAERKRLLTQRRIGIADFFFHDIVRAGLRTDGDDFLLRREDPEVQMKWQDEVAGAILINDRIVCPRCKTPLEQGTATVTCPKVGCGFRELKQVSRPGKDWADLPLYMKIALCRALPPTFPEVIWEEQWMKAKVLTRKAWDLTMTYDERLTRLKEFGYDPDDTFTIPAYYPLQEKAISDAPYQRRDMQPTFMKIEIDPKVEKPPEGIPLYPAQVVKVKDMAGLSFDMLPVRIQGLNVEWMQDYQRHRWRIRKSIGVAPLKEAIPRAWRQWEKPLRKRRMREEQKERDKLMDAEALREGMTDEERLEEETERIVAAHFQKKYGSVPTEFQQQKKGRSRFEAGSSVAVSTAELRRTLPQANILQARLVAEQEFHIGVDEFEQLQWVLTEGAPTAFNGFERALAWLFEAHHDDYERALRAREIPEETLVQIIVGGYTRPMYELIPKVERDIQQVDRFRALIKTGTKLDPLLVVGSTIVDGTHRAAAYLVEKVPIAPMYVANMPGMFPGIGEIEPMGAREVSRESPRNTEDEFEAQFYLDINERYDWERQNSEYALTCMDRHDGLMAAYYQLKPGISLKKASRGPKVPPQMREALVVYQKKGPGLGIVIPEDREQTVEANRGTRWLAHFADKITRKYFNPDNPDEKDDYQKAVTDIWLTLYPEREEIARKQIAGLKTYVDNSIASLNSRLDAMKAQAVAAPAKKGKGKKAPAPAETAMYDVERPVFEPEAEFESQSPPVSAPAPTLDENDPFKLVLGAAHQWACEHCETNEEYAKAMAATYPVVVEEYPLVKNDVQNFVSGKSKKVSAKVRKMLMRFEKVYRGGAYNSEETERYNAMSMQNCKNLWAQGGAPPGVIEMGEKWARKDAAHLSTQISEMPEIQKMVEHMILPYSCERARKYVESLTPAQ